MPDTTGRVTALDGDSAEVQVGNFGVRVQQDSLERRAQGKPAASEPTTVASNLHPSPGVELDLRGQRVEEILPRLDKYLDNAFLAGLPLVRIIHGKGTGVLRQTVREQLRDHPLVKSQRSELLENADKELVLLSGYLPEPLSQKELLEVIDAVIAETGASSAKDMGSVMKGVLARVGSRAEARQVSSLVKQKLSPSQ